MVTLDQIYRSARAAERLVGNVRAELRGMVRRVVVARTTSGAKDTARSSGTTFGDASTDGEQLQQYGFASAPPPGGEGLYFRAFGVVICVDYRKNRPALQGAEVAMWHKDGAIAVMRDDGSIVLLPKAGQKLDLGGEPGAEFVALATKVNNIITTLDNVFRTGWIVAPQDGGAALKAAYLASFPSPPQSVAAQNVRAT